MALNGRLLDASQRPAYLLAMIQQWLAFTLQVCVAVLAVGIVGLATRLRSDRAFAGASLVTLMGFGESLMYIVQFYTVLETSIGAVGRLRAFGATVEREGERDGAAVVPVPEEWPLRGGIEIVGVSASYEGWVFFLSLPSSFAWNGGAC